VKESHSTPAAAAAAAVDDDDDDDDVDLSAYDLGGGDADDDDQEIAAAPVHMPTREELLLMRAARDTAGKSTKTYFVDDQARSIEKSAGSERKLDQLKLKKMIAQGKLPVPTATKHFDPREAMGGFRS